MLELFPVVAFLSLPYLLRALLSLCALLLAISAVALFFQYNLLSFPILTKPTLLCFVVFFFFKQLFSFLLFFWSGRIFGTFLDFLEKEGLRHGFSSSFLPPCLVPHLTYPLSLVPASNQPRIPVSSIRSSFALSPFSREAVVHTWSCLAFFAKV